MPLASSSPASMVRPMRRVLTVTGTGLAAALPVALGAGYALAGAAGMWGALLGLGLPAVFLGITVVVALLTARAPAGLFAAVVLGSWLLKIVAMMAVLVLLGRQDGWSRPAFFAAFTVGVVGWLAAEATVLVRSRTPYVEPAP